MITKTQSTMSLSTELMAIDQLKEAWLRSEPIEFGDPIHAHTKLPHRETYFPLGFPVSITTNSPEVLQIADQHWRRFTQLFDREPIQLQIGVSASNSPACPDTPVCRMRNHILTNIADSENFSITDLSRGSAIIWVTEATLRQPDYFRYFFLESTAMANISGRFATGIHGACISLDGAGVLLCGDSGAGKSTLSYACARAGWTYITDDGSYLVHGRKDRLVVGNYRQVRFRESAEALFPELHGLSVIQRAGVGKPSVELFTHANAWIPTASTAHIRHIIFLKRNVDHQELVPFPRAVARLYMEQRVQCIPYDVDPQMHTIDWLLELEPHELRYNDLDWAIDTLTCKVREGWS